MPRRTNIIDRTSKALGELRCPSCNKLLIKEIGGGTYSMEAKCPRCGELSLFVRRPLTRKH